MAAGSSIHEPMATGRLQVGQRIWLHRDGRPAMGFGTYKLLVNVETTGSLSRAAAEMGMAYSKAWQSVRQAEAAVGFPILERQTGGKGGGGSTLSAEGKWLIKAFGELLEESSETMKRLEQTYLAGCPDAAQTARKVR